MRKIFDGYVDVDTRNMSREDWLKARKSGIGGSDASAITGMNPWSSPLQVYIDKTTEEIDNSTNFRMELGNKLEDFVAREFTDRTGLKVQKVNGFIKNKKYPFAFANIDRRIVGGDCDAILECKTTNSYARKDWENGVPPHYELQVMHYLALTGAEKCYVAALIGNEDFQIHEIARDEETINFLMDIEKDFWERYIDGDDVPDPDGSAQCSELIKKRYAKAEDDTVINLEYIDKAGDKLDEYMELKTEKKALDTRIKKIEQVFQEEMKESSQAVVGDYKITWKNMTRTSLDTKKLKSEHADLVKKYEKVSEYRRFDVKK